MLHLLLLRSVNSESLNFKLLATNYQIFNVFHAFQMYNIVQLLSGFLDNSQRGLLVPVDMLLAQVEVNQRGS